MPLGGQQLLLPPPAAGDLQKHRSVQQSTQQLLPAVQRQLVLSLRRQQYDASQDGHQATASTPSSRSLRAHYALTTPSKDPSAANPVGKYYPGFFGGALYYQNKLRCQRTVCTPGWRSSCGDTANCRNKHCRSESAGDGSICDINPCIQGNCYRGICMGGSGATCPSHTNECRQYKCSPKTGQCRESCPVPNGTPCNNGLGSCLCGSCVPVPPKCPSDPDKCNKYVFDEATKKCNLVTTQCTQPSDPKYECKELRCKKGTGLCTAFWNKPDNTQCSVGKCQKGVCVPSAVCPAKCPVHKNPCKYYECNEATGKCDIEKNVCEGGACPEGTCDGKGNCIPAPKCPPSCGPHPNQCKVYECNFSTGKCTNERNKDQGATCTINNGPGKCDEGVCKPDPKCSGTCPLPTNPRQECKQLVCNGATGVCDLLANQLDGTLCKDGKCVAGECIQATCPVVPCKSFVIVNGQCVEVPATGGTCDDGNSCTVDDKCVSGVCQGTPKVCARRQGSACTQSVCNNATGNCEVVKLQDGFPCNDGVKCTQNDVCLNGTCKGTPLVCLRRRQTFPPCKTSSCDEATGTCKTVNAAANTTCGPGSGCTVNICDGNGNCQNSTTSCSALNGPCKRGECIAGRCQEVAVNPGQACEDNLLCINSVCIGTSCTPVSPVTCPPPGGCFAGATCVEVSH
uniref:TNFR-Cys domain-containing protein n=1 Tax=Tetradesmus obliquus TaxID=3088 RepID=A0A383V6V3_TETOB|eukprot:jgi/Sobl393_1/15036/SZX60314.1